jgi:fucose permease
VDQALGGTQYSRDRATGLLFGGLFAFGFLNAVLGPALPYLRSIEHLSYLAGSLHQVAFAVGGGLAGLGAARLSRRLSRNLVIGLGLALAGAAGLGVGYGNHLPVTVGAAFCMSLLGTSALVRIWAALADLHGARRTVALAEGEVLVSLGGILAPIMVGGLAATFLTWRFSFVIGAAVCALTVLAITSWRTGGGGSPAPRPSSIRARPTLVVVFAIVALEFSLSFWLASYLSDSVGLPRDAAVIMVSGLYAANLLGRVITSRLARRIATERLLLGSLVVVLAGLPILLAAGDAAVAALGIAVVGAGVGATFPLSSALHVGAGPQTADVAVGQVLAVASPGQILGPVVVGAIAQVAGLRAGLLVLPACVLMAGVALNRHRAIDNRP